MALPFSFVKIFLKNKRPLLKRVLLKFSLDVPKKICLNNQSSINLETKGGTSHESFANSRDDARCGNVLGGRFSAGRNWSFARADHSRHTGSLVSAEISSRQLELPRACANKSSGTFFYLA